jgi:AsmA protein
MSGTSPVWNVMMRALKFAGVVIAAVVVVIALLLVVGVPSGFFTSTIAARVERDTGYRLAIAGASRISLWPTLNVTLNDVTLTDPKDRDGSNTITVGRLQADMTLSSAWSGQPDISELVITAPVLRVPLLRERRREAPGTAKTAAATGDTAAVSIKRVTVSDGTIVFSNPRDRVENRIGSINVEAVINADRSIKVDGTARASERPLTFVVKATAPPPPLERQSVPVELTLDMPDMLGKPLTAKADVRLNGRIVMINGISGTLDDGAFDGWASVDVASKPLVKLDIDFRRLAFATPNATSSPGAPWSNAPIELNGLNYVDAQIRLSAAQMTIADASFAPAAIEAVLAGGVLKASAADLGAYGGQASGEVIMDASSGNPNYAAHIDLLGVRALPLLQSLAGFDKLDGKMQAKIAVRSAGASQRAIMSNLNGTAFVNFQDGAVRGLNVARMIRSLASATLSGWPETRDETTDLSQLAASFNVERGQATTTDLNLVGPLVRVTGTGTVDVGTKSLAFRVEPKLVATTEGQGRAIDPVGLGIPVVIDGPWASPRIYPDMAGILDNPDAAYAKLKEMGKGLFGPNGAGLGDLINGLTGLGGKQGNNPAGGGDATPPGGTPTDPSGGDLGAAIGNLIQQGLGGSSAPARRGRSIPGPQGAPDAPAAPPAARDNPDEPRDSQPMNDVLRRLFNR